MHFDGMVAHQGALLLHISTSQYGVCSPHVHVGFLRVFGFPPTSKKHAGRWIGDLKLPLGVNACAHGTL